MNLIFKVVRGERSSVFNIPGKMKHSAGLLLPLLLAVLSPLPWQGRRDATAGDCVRHRDAMVISKHKSSLGILDELHSAVDELQKGGRVPPHLGVLLQEQVVRASRGLCSVEALEERVNHDFFSTRSPSGPDYKKEATTRSGTCGRDSSHPRAPQTRSSGRESTAGELLLLTVEQLHEENRPQPT